MNKKKYIVRGGYVRSKNDKQSHFVSASNVAQLYRVKHDECVFPLSSQYDSELCERYQNKLISLRPRNDGKYSLHDVITKGTSHKIL